MRRTCTTSYVAKTLGIAEPTVRKRTDLPVLETLSDGQRLYDRDAIDILGLEKAMNCEGLGAINTSALVRKFADRLATCNRDQADALLKVAPLILVNASEADRTVVANALSFAILRGPGNLDQRGNPVR